MGKTIALNHIYQSINVLEIENIHSNQELKIDLVAISFGDR